MKWLYRILRLFFCPHKYEIAGETEITRSSDNSVAGHLVILECKHCGKLKEFRTTV